MRARVGGRGRRSVGRAARLRSGRLRRRGEGEGAVAAAALRAGGGERPSEGRRPAEGAGPERGAVSPSRGSCGAARRRKDALGGGRARGGTGAAASAPMRGGEAARRGRRGGGAASLAGRGAVRTRGDFKSSLDSAALVTAPAPWEAAAGRRRRGRLQTRQTGRGRRGRGAGRRAARAQMPRAAGWKFPRRLACCGCRSRLAGKTKLLRLRRARVAGLAASLCSPVLCGQVTR